MTTIPHTSSDLVQISRAEQRKQRLRELESEQAAEEAEALKMTEEQRQTLLKSFTSVKVEFTDLDGLRWSQALTPFQNNPPHLPPTTSNANTFVVLTNADLANFSAEDTIRVSASNTKLRSRHPQHTVPHLTTSLPQSSTRRHRDGSRSRSPIKGLFHSEPSQGSESSIQHSTDVPYFESSDHPDGTIIPVADNGSLSKHKQGIVSRGRRKRVAPPGLVPSASQVASSAADNLKQWRQPSSVAATHPLSDFAPKDSLLSKSPPLTVHSFVAQEPPYQVYSSTQHARARLRSILSGTTIPPRPRPFPIEPDTTPSPFLLSSASFGNGDLEITASISGDISEDDETPTTSPTRDTAGDWIH